LECEPRKCEVRNLRQGLSFLGGGIEAGPDVPVSQATGSPPPATPAGSEPVHVTAGSDRVLYIHQPNTQLRRKDRCFTVTRLVKTDNGERPHEEELLSVSPRKISRVTVMGNCRITLPALHLAASQGVPIFLMSAAGKYVAHLEPGTVADLELERRQWVRTLEPEYTLGVARAIVSGKIANSAAHLRWRLGPAAEGSAALRTLTECRHHAERASVLGELMGVEGQAAAVYFPAYSALLPEPFRFGCRSAHPPADPSNSLLSFGYTLLHQNVYSALKTVGLDPRIGFLHSARREFPALACDLTEEFRAPLVDRMVLDFLSSENVGTADFNSTPRGCWMRPEVRHKFIERFETLMWQPVEDGNRKTSRNWRGQIQRQAVNIAQLLLEKLNAYQPFAWRPPCSL
jgi:CRISPR-associated protein Cas1